MKIFRTAACGLTGIFCAGFLQSCGGYHAGSGAMIPTSISISLNPSSVIAGRAATLMWSATSGTYRRSRAGIIGHCLRQRCQQPAP
jgi:hypothetical protein